MDWRGISSISNLNIDSGMNTNLTWEDYHKMEKPVIRLESKMNFENLKKGSALIINKDNHGFKKPTCLEKAFKKELEFMSIAENGQVKCLTIGGRINYYNYKNLLIDETNS